MLYVIWVVGVLAAVMVSAKLTIGKEKSGKFERVMMINSLYQLSNKGSLRTLSFILALFLTAASF